jgi:hypothetical protein
LEVNERLERLRRRAELEQRLLLATGPQGLPLEPADVGPGPEPGRPDRVAADGTSADGTSADGTSADGTSADGTCVDGAGGPGPRDDPATRPGTGEPPAGMVYDVLAALQPVLARYPGLSVGVWPPGVPAKDPDAAVLLTLNEVDGLHLLMPRAGTPGGGRPGSGPVQESAKDVRSVAAELASLLRDPLDAG